MNSKNMSLFCMLVVIVGTVTGFDTSGCNVAMTCKKQCNAMELPGGAKFLCLHGTKYQQGLMYGKIMRQELLDTFNTLMAFYPSQKGYNYTYIATIANCWTDRYSYTYNWFIVGLAHGAKISLQNAKILNSMVALGVLDEPDTCAGRPTGATGVNQGAYGGGCAYAFVSPDKTASGASLIGRNYDYFYPFYDIARNMVVTVMVDEGKIPTAIISMPGQIYCQNCINSYEIFMELNNGGAAAGFCGAWNRKGLLINMLEYLQDSGSLHQLDMQMQMTRADIALILSAADRSTTKSWEFAPFIGMEEYEAPFDTPHVVTNYYQSPGWHGKGLLPVTDASTWHGLTRYNNLVHLINQYTNHGKKMTVDAFKLLWSTPIEKGGAVWKDTIMQLVYDTDTGILHLRSPKHGGEWIPVDLRSVFRTVPTPPTHVPNAMPDPAPQ